MSLFQFAVCAPVCRRALQLDAQKSCFCNQSLLCPLICQELVSQRQKVREERERLQAQLEHFRRCLTLPNIHWGRGHINGHMPRWPLTPALLDMPLTAKEQWQKQDGLEPDPSQHLKEPVLVLLPFWPVSRVTDWLQIQPITCHDCHGNSKPQWP